MNKAITTLAIDTSCDETSCAIVQGLKVLSNVLPSQNAYHAKYGGVVPSLARLAHTERIDNVVMEALKRAFPGTEGDVSEFRLTDYMKKIDQVAVTVGPGLAIALEVGIKKAKELALEFEKPFIAVNHMEGHLLSAFAERNSKPETRNSKQTTNSKLRAQTLRQDFETAQSDIAQGDKLDEILSTENYPVLGLLASGKHTEFVFVKGIGEYEIIGESLDDACGEAFDKVGRALGLGYPAGGTVAEFAKEHRSNFEFDQVNVNKSVRLIGRNKLSGTEYELPISMARSGDLNMSYSGLKTAVRQLIDNLTVNTIEDDKNEFGKDINALELDRKIGAMLTKEQIEDISVVFEEAAFRPIQLKLRKAIEEFQPKAVWLGGGVIANTYLRKLVRNICKDYEIKAYYPTDKKLTTDNAAMIGVAANLRYSKFGDGDYIPHDKINDIDRDPTLELGE